MVCKERLKHFHKLRAGPHLLTSVQVSITSFNNQNLFSTSFTRELWFNPYGVRETAKIHAGYQVFHKQQRGLNLTLRQANPALAETLLRT